MIAIVGCRILPMTDGGGVVDDGVILVDGRRIAYVGPRETAPAIPDDPETRVIRGEHLLALPGFINAHLHMGLNITKGYVDDLDFKDVLFEILYPAEAAATEEEGYLSALVGGLEALKSGSTTVLDHYHHGARTKRAVEALGLRAELALMALDFDRAHPPARNPDTHWIDRLDPAFGLRELEENVELALAARAEQHPTVSWRIGVNTTDTASDETIRRAVELASAHGLGMHVHLSQSPSEVRFSETRRGCSPVEFLHREGMLELNTAAAHATALSDRDIDLLAASNSFVAHCPVSNAKGGAVMAPIPELLRRGGRAALGTDATPADIIEVTRYASVLNKYASGSTDEMPAWESLRLATIDGARAIGRGHELGSLEAGKLADIVLVDTEQAHLQPMLDVPRTVVYNARGSDVHTVIVDGRIVVEEFRSTLVDEQEILDRYRRLVPGYWERVGFSRRS